MSPGVTFEMALSRMTKDSVRSVLALLALSMFLMIVACSSGDASCEGGGERICLVPLGNVSGDLVGHLVDHYDDEYGLKVRILDNKSIPTKLADPDREQVGGIALMEFIGSLFPEAYANPDAILVGLTPVDMYFEQRDWRFAFWVSNEQINKGVVSFKRMDPETFGMDPNEDLLYTRVRKVVTHLIGTLYYGLPGSDDPRSVMYNNVLSLDDLDLMGEKLPIEASR
jgi:predicted Zn-dependent protease